MRHRFTFFICSLALGALTSSPAGAQGGAPAAGNAGQARVLADKGFELYEAGQYEKAIEAFLEAEKTFHAPTILLMLARAHDKLGRMVQAQSVYQRIAGETLANYAPPAFFEAQATAKTELAALTKRIPTVEVIVTGAGPGDVSVTVDGVQAPPSQAVPQDPGTHTVVVSAPGHEPVTRQVTLTEGAHERVTVDVAAPAPPPDVTAPPGDSGASRGSILPAAIAFGVGGLGIGIGAVTGAMTLGKVGDLEEGCSGNVCGKDQESSYNSAHTLATVSTVGFVVGGVAAAAGVVLLFVRPGGGEPAQAGMVLGPGWVGVRGGF